MSFDKLFGNSRIKAWLTKNLLSDSLPSSIIFYGPDGVGKTTFARELAKAVNCRQPVFGWNPCDRCSSCARIDASIFADVTTIFPDGQFIKVDQIRRLVDEAYFRPFEGRRRVYIVANSERLREQAANALLKTLEEPPATSIIILITSSIDTLLPTIKSRAVKLAFAPLDESEMWSYLRETGRPDADNRLLVSMSFGSPGRALEIDLSVYKERRQELLDLLHHLLVKRNRMLLIKAAEALGKREREEFLSFMSILKSLLRDVILISLGTSDLVVNQDIVSSLTAFANNSVCLKLFKEIELMEVNLQRNINRQLVLEKTLLSIL